MKPTSWIWSVLLAIVATALPGCGGAGKAQKPAAEVVAPAPQPPVYPSCAELEEKAHQIWSPKIRGELELAVRIFEGEILASDAELAVNRLDEFTEAWVKTSTDACQKHTDAGTLDSVEHRMLASCLDRVLETQRLLIESMKTGGKTAIARAQTLPETVKSCTGEAIDATAATDMRGNPFGEKP